MQLTYIISYILYIILLYYISIFWTYWLLGIRKVLWKVFGEILKRYMLEQMNKINEQTGAGILR